MSGLELNAFAAFLESRRLDRDEILFHEGEPGSEMFIVQSGLIGSYVVEQDGLKREVYDFVPGNLFGEMAIAEGSVRSATVWAKEDSVLLVLEAIDFYRLVWEHPALAVKLLGNMARNLAAWLDEAAGYLGDLARWGEDARRRSLVDELTGLFNRRFLEESMRQRIGRGVDSSRPCALVSIDIDKFRDINASHGPHAGDAVIGQAGAAIGRIVAEAGPDGSVCARLSGDEFSIFLPESDGAVALAVAESIRLGLCELFIEFRPGPATDPVKVNLTASLGVATAPRDTHSMEGLVEAADKALFRAKEGGRNKVVVSGT
jgi:diguanylate cyclase (GGDEF)-like protein